MNFRDEQYKFLAVTVSTSLYHDGLCQSRIEQAGTVPTSMNELGKKSTKMTPLLVMGPATKAVVSPHPSNPLLSSPTTPLCPLSIPPHALSTRMNFLYIIGIIIEGP